MKIFRHVRIAAFVALGILAGAIGGALGQAGWYQIASPTGAELLQVLLNSSAYQNYVTLNQIRNTTGYQLSAATTGTIPTTPAINNLILTGAVTTATVNLPASPPDGQLFAAVNGTGSAFSGTITIASTDTSTIVGVVAIVNLAAGASAEYQYTAASKIWYRQR